MVKKLIVLILCISLFSNIFSCSKSKDNDDITDSTNESVTQATTEEVKVDSSSILASLPDANYESYEYKIWTSNWANTTLEVRQAPEEAETGEPVNDALFRRDRLVEGKYNIKIKYTILDDVFDMEAKAKKSVLAGDNAFDFVCGDMQNVIKTLAQSGAIIDFNTVPNVNLEKEWWSKYATRDLTIDGKFYFPTGDITPRYIKSPYLMMFNKSLFTDYSIEYPYKKVFDGTWTIDALAEIVKEKGKDLNSDGKYDLEDFYGIITEGMTAYCFLRGFGENIVAIKDGNPTITLGNEKSLNMIQKLTDFMATDDAYVDPQYRSYLEGEVFRDSRALFVTQTSGNLSLFREVEFDYGLLPMPKFDVKQESYYSYAQPWGAVAIAIPKTNPDVARTGMVIEALAAVGKYTSTPAEYEVTLKTKFTRDEDSARILDMICQTASYDFGPIYNWADSFNLVLNSINKQQPFTSGLEKIKDKMQTELDKTIENFVKISNE